jgi:putative ABC transport system permease protein
MRFLLLGLRLLRRDWRAGELAALAFALLLAVAASTAVGWFAQRLQTALAEQAAELLAADLRVESQQPLPAEWAAQAEAMGLRHALLLEFPSMAAAGERFLLVAVKAAEPAYPLRGTLRTALAEAGAEQPAGGIPPPGQAWADARVLDELGLALGDALELGLLRLSVTRILRHEPDRRPDFYSLSPRLLINAADLPASGLIQPGSRVHYHGLYAGPEWPAFKAWLQTRLGQGPHLLDVQRERPELGDTLTRAERYLGLAAVLVALLSGVAIAAAARRYALRHYDTVAMLRCLGAQRRQVRLVFASQLALLGLAASGLGVALGWLAQAGLLYWLRPLLPLAAAAPSWQPAALGAGSGLLVLAGFAGPALLRLERATPLRVLRRDLPPPAPAWRLAAALALAVAAALLGRYADNGWQAAALLLGSAALALLLAASTWAGLVLSRRWQPRRLAWRFALRNLNRHPGRSLAQVLAFAVTLAATAVTLVIGKDLLEDWHSRLDPRAPNYFAINLFETDRARFQQRLAEIGAEASRLYPIVRGRLVQINGRPAALSADKDSQGERALNRELNLTWTEELPQGNRLIAGTWPAPGASLEQKLAESLHLKPGDTLEFSIAGRHLTTTVTSIRSLRWDSMTPNFYAILPPDALQGQPHSYLTSFYLPAEQRGQLASLTREFPAATLLDVDQLLRQAQTLLRQISLAVDGMLAFALAAGLAVLWAAVLNQLDERLRQDALLRTLGAGQALLRRSRRLEFALLGALSGLLAALAAESIVWLVYRQWLHLDFVVHPWLWLALPPLGALLVGSFGLLATRRALQLSPVAVLREN